MATPYSINALGDAEDFMRSSCRNDQVGQREALRCRSILLAARQTRLLRTSNMLLCSYEKDHPKAKIDLYRQNSASVRIRIIDSAFRGMSQEGTK